MEGGWIKVKRKRVKAGDSVVTNKARQSQCDQYSCGSDHFIVAWRKKIRGKNIHGEENPKFGKCGTIYPKLSEHRLLEGFVVVHARPRQQGRVQFST